MNLLQKLLEFLAGAWLKNKFPQYAGILNNLKTVFDLVMEVVGAAEATPADGPAKKKQAASDLLKRLQEAKIDIPGESDLQVCEVLVEALVSVLNRFFPRGSAK